jgi:hypothetical protein
MEHTPHAAHAAHAPTYDSAEETMQEELQRSRAARQAAGNNSRLRVIRRRAGGNGEAAPNPSSPHVPAAASAGPAGPSSRGMTMNGSGGGGGAGGYGAYSSHPSAHGAAHPSAHGAAHPSAHAAAPGPLTRPSNPRPGTASATPARMPMFPSTLFWADKMQTLGAVYLVAEALVRSMLMESEEFADRVAWVALERLVRDTMAVRGAAFACGSASNPTTRAAVLVDVRRMLGEIRATHAAFHTAIDYTLIHGAILVLLRVTHLASLSAEYATAPYSHTLARHIQELVFLCDFAGMVLSTVTLTDAPHHEKLAEVRPDAPAIWLPAHYANEALVRALAPLDVRAAGNSAFTTSAVARAAAKLLSDNANAVSNDWLARNLLRMSIGYKMIANAWDDHSQQQPQQQHPASGSAPPPTSADHPDAGEGSRTGLADPTGVGSRSDGGSAGTRPEALHLAAQAAINEILRERAAAIQTWTQRHGSETGAVFMDPLYRIEEEIQPRQG